MVKIQYGLDGQTLDRETSEQYTVQILAIDKGMYTTVSLYFILYLIEWLNGFTNFCHFKTILIWPALKSFWVKFRTCTPKPSNQIIVYAWYSVQIGWHFNMSKKVILKICITTMPIRPYCHKKHFEYKFVLVLNVKLANQNTVSIKYFVLIGQFWSVNAKIVLESFMTMKSGLVLQRKNPLNVGKFLAI